MAEFTDREHYIPLRKADLILLLEEGRVVERGTHEELMNTEGVYHGMVQRQMASHHEDVEADWR